VSFTPRLFDAFFFFHFRTLPLLIQDGNILPAGTHHASQSSEVGTHISFFLFSRSILIPFFSSPLCRETSPPLFLFFSVFGYFDDSFFFHMVPLFLSPPLVSLTRLRLRLSLALFVRRVLPPVSAEKSSSPPLVYLEESFLISSLVKVFSPQDGNTSPHHTPSDVATFFYLMIFPSFSL